MFQNRDVNPHDYDTKLAFWTDVIERSCRDLSDPVISLSKLKKRFVRGDRIPAGLSTVMEHMLKYSISYKRYKWFFWVVA